MNFEWVNQHYGVNACIGRRVIAYGVPGTIVKDMGNHIGIVLDSAREKDPAPYHPIDGIIYGDVMSTNRQNLASRYSVTGNTGTQKAHSVSLNGWGSMS